MARGQLSAVSRQLSAISYQLSAISCQPSAINIIIIIIGQQFSSLKAEKLNAES
jgi:hypothetical protein